jgi:hypothetical protein
MSQKAAFHVPTCVCGHAVGDHKHAGTFVLQVGACFRCDCPKFEDAKDKRAA